MRISEVAEKTGLSISNIRFYEKKGLVGPDRDKDSKYRNYTEEDLALIKQILLFRKMDFSIETISNILNNKLTIEDAIQKQIAELEEKRDSIQSSIDLCKKIAGDGQYSSLDTDYYLSYVKEEEKKGRVFGQLNDLLDEVSDYYDYCFWNTPFAGNTAEVQGITGYHRNPRYGGISRRGQGSGISCQKNPEVLVPAISCSGKLYRNSGCICTFKGDNPWI